MKRALPAAALALLSCAPKYEGTGTLTIYDEPFTPTACHVQTSPPSLELTGPNVARVVLSFPGENIDFGKERTAKPRLEYQRMGTAGYVVDCASLTMRGEAYHAEGKRALSGKLELACDHFGGKLEFSGCF